MTVPLRDPDAATTPAKSPDAPGLIAFARWLSRGRGARRLLGVLDGTTAASRAAGGGARVLAIATFASVRPAGRSARVAERALRLGRRPVRGRARLRDPPQKIMFMDRHF